MRSKRRFYSSLIATVAVTVLVGCPGDSAEEQPDEGQVCPEDHLENTVEAAGWVSEHTDIAAYNYVADLVGGAADVAVLDGDGEQLGEMTVRQVFGHDELPDGALEVVFEGDSEPLKLVTTGRDVDAHGYVVEMQLQRGDDQRRVDLSAEFETVPCWLENDHGVAPECAGELALDSPAVSLPSCGVIVDDRIREERPPKLSRLTYSVAADDADATPSAGMTRRVGADSYHRIDVVDANGGTDPQQLEQWLADTGADELIGSDDEQLLTAAFLDRSWWREAEKHVAHCDFERASGRLDDPDDGETDAETQSLCVGDQDNDEWGSSNDSSGGEVWGDPHMVSIDGFAYDLQAAGEYILLEAHAGDPLMVQGRFEPIGESDVEGCGDLTWNTAAATRVGDRRVTARLYPEWEVRIDGEIVEEPDDIPEFEDGASVTVGPSEVNIEWPGGERVDFIKRTRGENSLTVRADLPPHRSGEVRGLLGQFDGDPTTDLVLPDGTVLDQPASAEDLYGTLAPQWRVTTSPLRSVTTPSAPPSFPTPG